MWQLRCTHPAGSVSKRSKKEYYINKAFEDIIPKKKYGLVISNCDYEFDENEIMLIFFVGEKAQNDGYIPPKTDLKNDDCKQMIDILTNVFLKKHINASGKETITNEIVLSFISRYISTNLDKEVHLKLKDYIYIYITEIIGGKRCKQKLDFDEPVLFFQ